MELPITRSEALEFLKEMDQEESDMNHYLESEAIMRGLARHFGEDEEYWGMLGLMHDVDWVKTKHNLSCHCLECADILKGLGFNDEFIRIVQSHAYGMEIVLGLKDKKRNSRVEHCLIAAETLTGLIHAYALMRGGISDMNVKGLKKKFKAKCFAEGCDRDSIKEIEKAGLGLGEFFEIGIEAIKDIKAEVGLV